MIIVEKAFQFIEAAYQFINLSTTNLECSNKSGELFRREGRRLGRSDDFELVTIGRRQLQDGSHGNRLHLIVYQRITNEDGIGYEDNE